MMSTSSSSSFVDVGVPLDSSGKLCDLDLKEPIAIVGLGKFLFVSKAMASADTSRQDAVYPPIYHHLVTFGRY